MITLNNINLSSIDLLGIDLRGIKLGLGGRGGGSGEGFPQLPGDVTRWHFGGLTNEMMAAMDDPRIEDADHKGRFLSFKNFAWKGMSGVGGYVVDIDEWGTNSTAAYFERNSIKITATFKENASLGLLYHNIKLRQSCVLKVTGIPKGCDAFLDDRLGNRFYMSEDGVYEIIPSNFLAEALYLSIEKYPERWYGSKLTIEQLPLYPGALVFDGVDDYGVCDNFPILTKEKGYTVVALRQWLSFQDIGYPTLVANSTDRLAAFSFEDFRNKTKSTWNWGKSVELSDYKIPLLYTYQTSTSYNSKTIFAGATEEGSNILQVCRSGVYCANAAIWEIVILDHDATEEELTKIKDYFVKTYPWLFPDQAWTVTGKTNEDEDRATIANITGNGNDLVLSNFGFAKGSGYGLYYQYFGEKFATTNGEIEDGGWNKIDNYNISHNKRIPINSIGKCYWSNEVFANGIKLRFKLTGMTEGDVLAFGYAGTYDLTYTSDGIYVIDLPPVDKTYGFSLQSSLTENLPTTPVTIKLLPFEYEGYLVTDGVDDKINSSNFDLGKDWTIVGDWTMLSNIPSNCGIIKASSLFLYNSIDSVTIYINNGGRPIKIQSKSINAICSDGRIYLNDWTEISKPGVQTELGSKANLNITSYGTTFTKMAFKNLAIYDGKILSKDDCIKAYNYLQTLKAK